MNTRPVKIAMYLCAVTAFVEFYFIRKYGLNPWFVFGLCTFGAIWCAGFILLLNKSPYAILSAKGISIRAKNSVLIKWDEIKHADIRYASIPLLSSKIIFIRMENTSYALHLRLLPWKGEDMLTAIKSMILLKPELRENYLDELIRKLNQAG